jgi:hypothetical protein
MKRWKGWVCLKKSSIRYWKGWMYLKESSIRIWKGGCRGGQDESKFNVKMWKGGGVLEGRFSEEMERLKGT